MNSVITHTWLKRTTYSVPNDHFTTQNNPVTLTPVIIIKFGRTRAVRYNLVKLQIKVRTHFIEFIGLNIWSILFTPLTYI